MNRNKRTAIVLGVAVLMAAIASLGVFRIVKAMPARAAEITTVNAVVAAHPLTLGTRLTADHVKVVQWPAGSPVPGSFTKVEDVVNRGLITTVGENEPLTETKLAPLEAGAGLPPSIPPGMRAISVKVNEVVGVAGFVVPGTRVDVMVTLSDRQRDQDTSHASRCQQRPGADRWHALRPGESQGRHPHAVHGGDAPRDAGRRGAHRARGIGGRAHARAAQPARHGSNGHKGSTRRRIVRSATLHPPPGPPVCERKPLR